MKKTSTLKVSDLKQAKRLPRNLTQAELMSLPSAGLATVGGTCTFNCDCDE